MKRREIALVILGILIRVNLVAQQYIYVADLVNIENDRVFVSLDCPEINKHVQKFCFPAIIPGHHFQVNYGRFVADLRAYDPQGDELQVEREGINDFIIYDATKLDRITYYVNDTKDSEFEEKVMGWSETNFTKDEVFTINAGGVFGFFEGMESIPVDLTFRKPRELYGSTSLKQVTSDADLQVFRADDYHQLVDCPVLFTVPDTASFTIAGCKITVACHNESGEKTAGYLAGLIMPRMQAVAQFAGGELPVNEYVFLYYLQDFSEAADLFYSETITPEKLYERIIERYGVPSPGALEHSNSSFHNLIFAGMNKLTDEILVSSSVHEFLHIYTPLNLRSNVRADFNYSTPVMSKHLWLYEGVTEYFSDLVMVKGGLMSISDFLNYELRQKLMISKQYPDNMSFTEMSEKIFEKPYKGQFMQVYYHGAVIAMLLDMEIMRLSEGSEDLRSILFKLIRRYGKSYPFREDELFSEICRMVHPDLSRFFENYIEGREKPDPARYLITVGIEYLDSLEVRAPVSVLSNGFGVKDLIEFFGAYTINEVSEGSPFRAGDKIMSQDFGYNCLKPFITETGDFIVEGESATVPLFRAGEWIELLLTPDQYEYIIHRNVLRRVRDASGNQISLYHKWISN